MPSPFPIPIFKPLGALAMAILLLGSCASGPRYGAARKQKKGCDCPKWNAVMKNDGDVHASVPHAPNN